MPQLNVPCLALIYFRGGNNYPIVILWVEPIPRRVGGRVKHSKRKVYFAYVYEKPFRVRSNMARAFRTMRIESQDSLIVYPSNTSRYWYPIPRLRDFRGRHMYEFSPLGTIPPGGYILELHPRNPANAGEDPNDLFQRSVNVYRDIIVSQCQEEEKAEGVPGVCETRRVEMKSDEADLDRYTSGEFQYTVFSFLQYVRVNTGRNFASFGLGPERFPRTQEVDFDEDFRQIDKMRCREQLANRLDEKGLVQPARPPIPCEDLAAEIEAEDFAPQAPAPEEGEAPYAPAPNPWDVEPLPQLPLQQM